MWSFDQVISFYRDFALEYDEKVNLNSYPAPFVVSQWLIDRLLMNKNTEYRILDLGCGTGQSSKKFFEHEQKELFRVTGVDASNEMLSNAKRLPFEKLLNGNIVEPIDFGNSAFDAIICVGVLDFIDDVSQFLSTLTKYAHNDTYIGITIPDDSIGGSIAIPDLERLLSEKSINILNSERIFGYQDSVTNEVVHYRGFLLSIAKQLRGSE